jgi:hypothetical protein
VDLEFELALGRRAFRQRMTHLRHF